MGFFLVYLIKSSVCFVFFYILNVLITGKGTLHTTNRWVWLFIMLICLLLPFDNFFCRVNWGVLMHTSSDVVIITGKDNTPEEISYLGYIYNILKFTGYIYIVGVLAILFRLGISYLSLIRLIRRANPDDGAFKTLIGECKVQIRLGRKVKLLLHNDPVVPFSWMNYVVVNTSDMAENGREILLHELSHIKSRHSYDVIFADGMLLLQWFNPACWLIKRALQQVHEYEADEKVIDSGVNAREYQMLLIKKAVGKKMYTMANGFNHSNLRNRIEMMLRKKQQKWRGIKYFYILPLSFGLMMFYTTPSVSAKLNTISLSFEKTGNAADNFMSAQPLFIVNDKVVDDIKMIKPDSIASITVLKDAPAIRSYEQQYGRDGKNGVIVIKLK